MFLFFTAITTDGNSKDPEILGPEVPAQDDPDRPFERPTGRTTRTGTPMAKDTSDDRLRRVRKWAKRQ